MPKRSTDGGQACSAAKQVNRQGMTQHVAPDHGKFRVTQSHAVFVQDVMHGRGSQRSGRGSAAQKQFTVCAWRTAISQVACQDVACLVE